jgi:CRP-like cAMP-binding protein/NAD-dependent dihydropyrimidine dehydrogenase PreA subunit
MAEPANLPPDEEPLFARDYDGRLIRVDAPSLDDLRRKVRVRVDGSRWFEVPKAVPATDEQGNILRNPDDTPVVRASTILDAARSASAASAGLTGPLGCPVRIPVLCHRDHLAPVGVCRVCVVQIVKPDPRRPDDPAAKRVERKLLPACQHRVEDGMEVHTLWSPEQTYRKAVRSAVQVLYELLVGDHVHPDRDTILRDRGAKYLNELSAPAEARQTLSRKNTSDLRGVLSASWLAHPEDCQSDRDIEDRNRVLGAEEPRFTPRLYDRSLLIGWMEGIPDSSRKDPRTFTAEERRRMEAAPPFVVDHNNCILCDRCIRACTDVKPFRVIGRTGKGAATRIAFDLAGLTMAESACRACGECMTACPTGAISFQYRVMDVCPDRLTSLLSGHGRLAEAAPVEADELIAHPLFARLSKAFLEWNRGAVRRRPVRPGDVVAVEGEYGTTAFVLEAGRLAVLRRGATARSIPTEYRDAVEAALRNLPHGRYGQAIGLQSPNATDVIGEMSSMSHTPRNATLVAIEKGRVLEIDRNVLHVLLRDPANREMLDRRYARRAVREFLPRLVDRSPLFRALRGGDGIQRLVEHVTRALDPRLRSTQTGGLAAAAAAALRPVEMVRADPGQLICREGEPADNFYLIRLGFVRVEAATATGTSVRKPLRQGDSFGEMALLTRSWPEVAQAVGRPVRCGVRTATCTALDHVELVMIPREVFDSFLDDPANADVRDALRRRCVEMLLKGWS